MRVDIYGLFLWSPEMHMPRSVTARREGSRMKLPVTLAAGFLHAAQPISAVTRHGCAL